MVRSLATLAIEGDILRLTAISSSRHEFCKSLLERYFESKLVLRRERVVDLVKQVMDRDDPPYEVHATAGTAGRELPSAEDQRGAAEAVFHRFYKQFLDDQIPVLDHMTPRQAAADPAMRPRLIELMKQHVYGAETRRREQNLDYRLDGVLRELGLEELL